MSAQLVDALTNAAQDVGDTPRLHVLRVVNPNAAIVYLQMFAKAASAVVLGTDVPAVAMRIQASEVVNIPFPEPLLLGGKTPEGGFSMAACTTAGGAAAPAAPISVFVVSG